MLKDLISEKSGLPWAHRIILCDPDGLVARAFRGGDCVPALQWISSAHELRYIYERDYRSTQAPAALAFSDADIGIPYDIAQSFAVLRLGLDNVFPQLDAEALRAARNIDYDYLSFAVQGLNGPRLTASQTRAFCLAEMYSSRAVCSYSAAAAEILKSRSAACATYREWTAVADLLSKLMLLRDKGLETAELPEAYAAADAAFRRWTARRYASLAVSADISRPVMLHHIPDFIRRASKKPALIVVDGMSFVDWQLIREYFTNAPWRFNVDATFSFLPSITGIARQALFSGAVPAHNQKPFSLADEEKQWRDYWAEHGLRQDEVYFGKTEAPDIPDRVKAAGIVVTFIDELVHRQLQGSRGMAVDIAAWLKGGALGRLIDGLLARGFDVFITSDHGHTEAVGTGRFIRPGLLTEDVSRRAVIFKGYADARELGRFNVTEYAGTYMPKDYRYFLFAAGECIGDRGITYVAHGGDSIEEMLVPFVRIGETQNG